MQRFVVIASLVLKLGGGQNDPPQALTFQKTPYRFLRVNVKSARHAGLEGQRIVIRNQ